MTKLYIALEQALAVVSQHGQGLRCFVALLGHIFSYPMHQQGADALWSTVCSSPAPRLIAPSVVSPRQA